METNTTLILVVSLSIMSLSFGNGKRLFENLINDGKASLFEMSTTTASFLLSAIVFWSILT